MILADVASSPQNSKGASTWGWNKRSKCKDKCGKCCHDGNCGFKGKCKDKCCHDGNCGCNKCPPPYEVKCTGITSSSLRNYDEDCDTGCADAVYPDIVAHAVMTCCGCDDNGDKYADWKQVRDGGFWY